MIKRYWNKVRRRRQRVKTAKRLLAKVSAEMRQIDRRLERDSEYARDYYLGSEKGFFRQQELHYLWLRYFRVAHLADGPINNWLYPLFGQRIETSTGSLY